MATKGHSTKVSYGNQANHTDSTTWTPFAKVTSATPPKVEADDVETSHMESPGQFKEFEAGWADGGEVELTIQFEKTKNAEVYALFRANKGFRMELVDGSHWDWSGYIKSFGNEIDRQGIITTNITMKVSGQPVFTAAASA